jgi:hypothetical protein
MFLRSTSFGRLNKREDLCYASKLIRIFGPQGLYPLTPSPIRYHQPLNISCEVQQLPRNSGGSLLCVSFEIVDFFAPFLDLALPFLVLDPFFLRAGRGSGGQPPLLFLKALF